MRQITVDPSFTATQQEVTIPPMGISRFTATQQEVTILPMGISRFTAIHRVRVTQAAAHIHFTAI